MYRIGKYSAQAIGFYELFKMNLDEIILLDKIKAGSIFVRNDIPNEYIETIKKCSSIYKKVLRNNKGVINPYYSHNLEIPITVGELLKVFSFEGGYKDIEKYIEKSPKLNEDEFKNIYNGYIKYVSLDEEDIIKINAIKNYRKLADNKKIEIMLNSSLDSIVFLNRITAVNMILDINTPIEVKQTLKKSIVFSEVDTMDNKRGYNSLIDIAISLEEILKVQILTKSDILKNVRPYEYLEDKEDIKTSYKMGLLYLSLNEEDLKELNLSDKSEYVKKRSIKKDNK